MENIVFKCEVITPMFLAGADGITPELRPPSIKGALRFWWRALNGHRYTTLEKLKKAETSIFGGTGDNSAQKSNISIKISEKNITPSSKPMPYEKTTSTIGGKERFVNILDYLLIGIYEFQNGLTREYIKPDGNFNIICQCWKEEYKAEILQSFLIMSKYGGLGAKTRNGFGCFQISGIEEEIIDFSIYGMRKDYTAFSRNTKVFETGIIHNSWHEALGEIGIAYKTARTSIENHHHYENRQYIASPIIVNKKQVSTYERYSKPYFLHVDKYKEGYKGKILYLPSNYAVGLAKNDQEQQYEDKAYMAVCNEMNAILVKQGLKEVSHG